MFTREPRSGASTGGGGGGGACLGGGGGDFTCATGLETVVELVPETFMAVSPKNSA